MDFDKNISIEYDINGKKYWIINGLLNFICNSFDIITFEDVEEILDELGIIKIKGFSTGYAFKSEINALEGLEKLFNILNEKGSYCYHNGHDLDVENIKKGQLGTCKNCLRTFGWVCTKNSPVIICEYDKEKDPMCDNCLYCGEPAERK